MTPIPKERAEAPLIVRVVSVVFVSGALLLWWSALSATLVSGIQLERVTVIGFFLLGFALASIAVGLRLMHRWAVTALLISAALLVVTSFIMYGMSFFDSTRATTSFLVILVAFLALFFWERRDEFK